MMEDEIQKYIRCMVEIKLRDQVIKSHLTGKCSTGQPITDSELICLQFRKIAELILLSALCAHRDEYLKVHRNIEKEWDTGKIQRTLDNIQPDFYPVPFVRVVDQFTGKEKIQRVTNGFLSKDECISLICQCGKILHGFNPYNDVNTFKEVEDVKDNFPEWLSKIRRLLYRHEIKLFGTDKRLWVYMCYGAKRKVLVEERVPRMDKSM